MPVIGTQLALSFHQRNIQNQTIMAFFKEFKEFALKGNVMDMAVGVIIGGAFGKIVSSLVNDILMPPIGALLGNTDFSHLRVDISKVRDVTSGAVQGVGKMVGGGSGIIAEPAADPIYWNYGAFIQQCVDFTILALCVFLMVKLMNKLIKKRDSVPAPEPAPTKEELLLREIRDLLRERTKE
jgi:large conductance mechanosensitive channel